MAFKLVVMEKSKEFWKSFAKFFSNLDVLYISLVYSILFYSTLLESPPPPTLSTLTFTTTKPKLLQILLVLVHFVAVGPAESPSRVHEAA